MEVKRQKKQVQTNLPFFVEGKGETLNTTERVETAMAKHNAESPAGNENEIKTERLMEDVVDETNLLEALKRVISNKGSPGIDGMTINELATYIHSNWPQIRNDLVNGLYKPQPVRRMEIPKPSGGFRKLGIPTVMDRLVQQMLLQVLQNILDPTFSEHSYGFRPGRSAHQAVAQAQEYIEEGHEWVVDIDLEKFFDRVNHDILMGLLAGRIKDKRILKLVRAFLNAGVMENGLFWLTNEGTPQGGPLSPLLSNIVLDVLDRELEKRCHKFVRYADDCNIYVKSKRSGDRVMESIIRFLERKLKLPVNREKSVVRRANEGKFLGFSFTIGEQVKRRISPQALNKFKTKVRQITRRSRGINLKTMITELSRYLRGWFGYFGFCETPSVLRKLDRWIRHRLRCFIWKQWKTAKNRRKELRRLGVTGKNLKTGSSGKGPWRISRSKAVQVALPNKFFDQAGLYRLNSS